MPKRIWSTSDLGSCLFSLKTRHVVEVSSFFPKRVRIEPRGQTKHSDNMGYMSRGLKARGEARFANNKRRNLVCTLLGRSRQCIRGRQCIFTVRTLDLPRNVLDRVMLQGVLDVGPKNIRGADIRHRKRASALGNC